MSDRYGRVLTMMISTTNVLITGIATPFVDGYVTFAVVRFLMGLSFPTFFMCVYMLSKFRWPNHYYNYINQILDHWPE